MAHHKHFQPLPEFAREHPQADRYRIERLENTLGEHLDECHLSRNDIQDSWRPLIAQALLWLFGLLCLGSPEKAAQLLDMLKH